ncbi:MAG TPA: ATP-binding protein [Chthoniobacteraceae bacterium]|nr:ATP-binding protein [Chthoniobacteraceae bacterium]
MRFIERAHPEQSVALASLAAPNRLLGLLAEADMRGRISVDKAGQTQAIETARLYRTHAAELGCLDTPYPFANAHSRFTYFSKEGETGLPFEIFDPTAFEVTMLCGLPGVGKDLWISKSLPAEEAVLSRDEVRADLKEEDVDDEGRVLQEVLLRTRQLLAKKQNFAINATNLRRDLRRGFLQLCHAYGARTRLVFLHADRAAVLRRNAKRPDETRVPVAAIDRFAKRMETPDWRECYNVQLVDMGDAGR